MSRVSGGKRSSLKQAFWWLPIGRVPDMSADELQTQLQDTAVQLIDVRTPAEYRRSHIAAAINVPITGLRKRLPLLDLEPHRPVVTICLSAHRSIPAVRLLQAHGYEEVRQLRGGMIAWWRAHLPTEQS